MRWPWSRPRQRIQADPRARRPSILRRAARFLRAGYDAAKTTDHNSRHWAEADDLSPAAAASSDVRNILRARARYEVANNSIARGIVLTLGNDLIGSGPRLQLHTDSDELNRRVELLFGQWAAAVQLGRKLRTMRYAKAQDGEAFGVLFTNPRTGDPVHLDVRLIEAERVATPPLGLLNVDESEAVDGIEFDEAGNPIAYHLLDRHPGSRDMTYKHLGEYHRIDARSVLHWFREDRPGQRRGLPDIMPALPLFAILRRFTLATVTAAETAADISVVMKTNMPPGGDAAEVDPWITMDLERNMAMFAPEGWEPSQLKPEHPSTAFGPFREAIISEIARCLNMPYNVAACNSSSYNYASGRLDHQTYFKSVRVERAELGEAVLDRIFQAWLREAVDVREYSMFGEIARAAWPHAWVWPGREHVDPLKEANAAKVLNAAGLLTSARYYARQGLDWEVEFEQAAREAAKREKLGLPDPTQPKGAPTAAENAAAAAAFAE